MAQSPESTERVENLSPVPNWTGELSELQVLRQELAGTQKKLQAYADTIISLYNEMRILKENICKDCKQRFAPLDVAVASSQPAGAADASSSFFHHARPDMPPQPTDFSHVMLRPGWNGSQGPESVNISPGHTPIPVASTLVKSLAVACVPHPVRSNEAVMPIESTVSRWSVKRDANVNATLDVMFVREFIRKDHVWSVKFSPDGKHLAASLRFFNGPVVIFDVETGKQTCSLAEYASKYSSQKRPINTCMCFSPNGKYLAIGDAGGRVTVWDILKKRIRNKFKGHRHLIESVDFSPEGQRVASASFDKTVRICNMRDGIKKVFAPANAKNFWSVRFSPNGRYVAAGDSDGVLRMWNVRTGCMVVKQNVQGDIWSLAFTPEGSGLVTSIGRAVKYWDISSLGMVQWVAEMLEYKGHRSASNCIAISPDSQWVASASDDKTVIVWNTLSAVRQCILVGHSDSVSSVDFSPTGTYLATGGSDGLVTLWRYRST